MSAFQQALAADRGAYAAAYNLGVLADRAGNSGQAREFYRQALQILPDYEDAARGMVALHLRANSISGDLLSTLEDNDLLNELGIEKRLHRRKILLSMKTLRGMR